MDAGLAASPRCHAKPKALEELRVPLGQTSKHCHGFHGHRHEIEDFLWSPRPGNQDSTGSGKEETKKLRLSYYFVPVDVSVCPI